MEIGAYVYTAPESVSMSEARRWSAGELRQFADGFVSAADSADAAWCRSHSSDGDCIVTWASMAW